MKNNKKAQESQLTIDELSNKIQDANEDLDELKEGIVQDLSIEESNQKLENLENTILLCTQSLEDLEADSSVSVDEEEELKKLKSQIDLLRQEKDSLQNQISNQATQTMSEDTEGEGDGDGEGDGEGDNKTGNIKERLGTKRNGLTNTGKNILRTLGGIGIVAGVYGLGSRIFGGKKYDYEKEIPGYKDMSRKDKRKARKKLIKEKRAERGEESFRDRPLGKTLKFAGVCTGVYYVAHGMYTKNWGLIDAFDWEKGKKLKFDAALEYCKGAIANQDDNEGMSYGLNLKYDENTGEIEAYGERIKIDKDRRKIPGVGLEDVKFKKYESMINTAILIAYLKKNYSGKCKNNTPFHLTSNWQGDVNVNTYNGDEQALDGTGNKYRILGISAAGIAAIMAGIRGGLKKSTIVGLKSGIVGYAAGYAIDSNNTMHDNMPELDDEFGRKSLGAYLNSLNCWQAKNQTAEDITESPIKKEVIECMEDIQNTHKELEPKGARRQIDAIQDPNDEKKYTIKAYGRDFSAEVTGNEGDRKIRILGISGGNPTIKTDIEKSGLSTLKLPLKEGLYMSYFIGFLLDNYCNTGVDYPRFNYTSRGLGLRKGIYLNCAETISKDFDRWVLSEDKFEKNMPTLFQEQNREILLKFLNDGILNEQNISIWKKQ